MAPRRRRALMTMLLAALSSQRCGAGRFVMREAPVQPFDVVVVPGCPTTQEGAPSRCLLARAGWASLVYQRGWAKRFITSGGAVHSPYIEAEMLAAIMAALGVPADRIIIEPHALHTDENMYNALQIAKALSLERIAVASDAAQAGYAARMMQDWGSDCRAFAMDEDAVAQLIGPSEQSLRQLRVRRTDEWIPIGERERLREQKTGRSRPPSFVLYPMLGYLAWIGKPWRPIAPDTPSLTTWDQLRGSVP